MFHLLDEPWSQVSSLDPPPPASAFFLLRREFSIPMFSSIVYGVFLSRALALVAAGKWLKNNCCLYATRDSRSTAPASKDTTYR